MNRLRVGILGYDGVTAINLVGPLEALSNAVRPNKIGVPECCYEVSIVACDGDQFVADSGLTFRAQSGAGNEFFDTIIVPGGRGMRCDEVVKQISSWIKAHADNTRRIATVCTGVYGLACTGLLDGRRVTTHWQNALDVAVRFPKLRVEESELVLKDGKFYSAAGATAGIDLALFLIAEDFGRETSVAVARKLLVYVERAGGQEQYSEPAAPDSHFGPDTRELHTNGMGKLVNWMSRHLGEDLSLEILAKRVVLSKNDFIQQFTQTLGVPPGLFVKNLRFNEARRLLMSGEEAVKIAHSVGFADPAYFIQEFRRRFGLLPSEYQRRFGCSMTSNGLGNGRNGITKRSGARAKPSNGRERPRITSFTRCVRRQSGLEPEVKNPDPISVSPFNYAKA
jgi:transcriptional regulator GlxA family with amidase domain